jgi:hypothetical protein
MPFFWRSAADFCRLSRGFFLLSTTSAKPSTKSFYQRKIRGVCNFFASFNIKNLKFDRTVVQPNWVILG